MQHNLSPLRSPPSGQSAERRCRRSSDPLEALGLMLEATRRRTGARTIAVADTSGLLIAGAGVAQVCDELAAVAAARAPQGELPFSLYPDADARAVRLGLSSVVVCVEGDASGRAGSHSELEQGCRRILGRA